MLQSIIFVKFGLFMMNYIGLTQARIFQLLAVETLIITARIKMYNFIVTDYILGGVLSRFLDVLM